MRRRPSAVLPPVLSSRNGVDDRYRTDGKKVYNIESVTWAEDELILLHKRGALAQDAIRHYLVYRGGFNVSDAAYSVRDIFSVPASGSAAQ